MFRAPVLAPSDAALTPGGARRRRSPSRFTHFQCRLLASALEAAAPGGVVAYVTCSPHRHETADVVHETVAQRIGVEILNAGEWLPEVPESAASTDPRFVQLWPHRHGTDAMFLALLRVN